MQGSLSPQVGDSSVLISLHSASILAIALQLPFRWIVPDVILEEMSRGDSTEIRRICREHRVEERELTPRQVRRAESLILRHRGPSRIDLFALALAMSLRAGLLTGDGDLRSAAEKEGVTVHGVLWLLDQMIENHLTSKGQAASALRQIVDAGTWLPRPEVERRLTEWDG